MQLVRRQREDGALELRGKLATFGVLLRRLFSRRPLYRQVQRLFGPTAHRANPVVGCVGGYAEQPGPQRATPEAADGAVCGYERFLRRVVGRGPAAQYARRRVEHERPVALNNFVERLKFTCLASLYQLGFVELHGLQADPQQANTWTFNLNLRMYEYPAPL